MNYKHGSYVIMCDEGDEFGMILTDGGYLVNLGEGMGEGSCLQFLTEESAMEHIRVCLDEPEDFRVMKLDIEYTLRGIV
jgi:hypothetical protein